MDEKGKSETNKKLVLKAVIRIRNIKEIGYKDSM